MNSLLPLSDVDVHVWLASDEASAAQIASYRPLLSESERAQADRFHFERDRIRFTITRALVRSTLSRYQPIPAQAWTFSQNSYGRPEISNADALRAWESFNVSHTPGLIALAVGRRVVGVDVEYIGGRETSLAIARRYFSPAEVVALSALPVELQTLRFFELWTFKEAYIKARGLGLSLPLNRFSFEFPAEQSVRLTIEESLNDTADRWQLFQLRPSTTHLLALCVERAYEMQLTVREVVPLSDERLLPTPTTRQS